VPFPPGQLLEAVPGAAWRGALLLAPDDDGNAAAALSAEGGSADSGGDGGGGLAAFGAKLARDPSLLVFALGCFPVYAAASQVRAGGGGRGGVAAPCRRGPRCLQSGAI
jgi:hypothetical protein